MTSNDLLSLASPQGITLDPCLLKDYPIGTYFYAVHHQSIAEPLTEPLANRIHYILTEKPANERKTRLAALRPLLDQKARATCDKACAKARAAYAKARAAYAKACDKASAAYDKACDKARATCDKAYAKACDKAYAKARAAYDKAMLALWNREYPGHPAWGENGLVFPKKEA
jgi:hypothetical protein